MKKILKNDHFKTIMVMLAFAIFIYLTVLTDGALFAVSASVILLVIIYSMILGFIRGDF